MSPMIVLTTTHDAASDTVQGFYTLDELFQLDAALRAFIRTNRHSAHATARIDIFNPKHDHELHRLADDGCPHHSE